MKEFQDHGQLFDANATSTQTRPAREDSRSTTDVSGEVLDALTAHIAVLDTHGVIVAVNEAWRRFARENGDRDETFHIGANYLTICEDALRRRDDETIGAALRGIRAVLRGEQDGFSLEYPCHSPDEERWFVLRVTRFSRQVSAGVVVAHEDITAGKRAERTLRETEQTLRLVLETLPVGVWIMDRTGRIVHGNRAGQQIWAGGRYVGPEHFGEYKGWWVGTGRPIAADEWAAARAIRNGETSIGEEIRIECFDGTSKVILNSALPLHDAENKIAGAIIVNQDITARKHAEEELRRAKESAELANRELQLALAREQLIARTDDLTGVNSRRHFFELAAHDFAMARRQHRPLSAIVFDIDYFKRVNDTLGHQVGDEILKRVARIACEQLREADVIARLGGEEFIVLLPDSDARHATVAAERIRSAIAAHAIVIDGGSVRTTISAGVADALPQDDTLEGLIRRADEALYQAKGEGRNRTVTFVPAEPVHT